MSRMFSCLCLLAYLHGCTQPARPALHAGGALTRGAHEDSTQPASKRAVPRASEDASQDWQHFDARAVARAQRERKLILLSVQAEFCHWCHVMNQSTYRDARVRELLQRRFAALRIDQAEDPALSARYADYGWPATALLTPDAEPIVTLRGHQPVERFLALLQKLVADFDAGRPLSVLRPRADQAEVSTLSLARERALSQLDGAFDARAGGWGSPQKYPFAAPVEHAFYRAFVHGEPARRELALQTLHGHSQLLDGVAGGMFQYSLRGVWSAPHFEKLAEIQAGALRNFAEAYQASGERRWLEAARRVAGYVLRELRNDAGVFAASQHADAGELGAPGYLSGSTYYQKSAQQRASVNAPSFDTHVYADLNGMLIAGLVQLARASGEADFLRAAEAAAARIDASHRRGAAYVHEAAQDGSLLYLSDQVEMAAALLALADATDRSDYLQRGYATLDFVRERLLDPERGDFFAHTEQAGAVGIFAQRDKPPAANARLIRLLLRRAHREADPSFATLAERALQSQSVPEALEAQGRKVGDSLLALEQAEGPYVMFSVVGPRNDPRTQALRQAAYRAYAPHSILRVDEPGQGRYPYPDQPAVYMCSDSACSAPVFSEADLKVTLATFVRQARAQ